MVGNPLTYTLMGSFLIEVMGIFPDNSQQMSVIENEGVVQTFSS